MKYQEHSGNYFVLEGADGTGKTSQVELVSKRLIEDGYDVVTVREPGQTGLGKELREILLNGNYDLSKSTEFLLFSADRRDLFEKIIIPALEEGKVVISDRNFLSSGVYQFPQANISSYLFTDIVYFSCAGIIPKAIYLLIHNNGGYKETVATNTSNFEEANEEYKKLLNVFKNCIEISAEKSKEEITEEIYQSIKAFIVH